MLRRVAHSWILVALLLAGLAVLTVRKDASGISGAVLANSSSAPGNGSGTVVGSGETKGAGRPRSFSAAYDYCYIDEEGRPMVFHQRRLVYLLPEAPPEVHDRTFTETDQCQ